MLNVTSLNALLIISYLITIGHVGISPTTDSANTFRGDSVPGTVARCHPPVPAVPAARNQCTLERTERECVSGINTICCLPAVNVREDDF